MRLRNKMRLDDVERADTAWIGRALGSWACSEKWSSIWARTADPAILSGKLWHDVAWQRVVKRGSSAVGLLQLVGVSMDDGVGHFEVLIEPRHLAEIEALLSEFLDGVFDRFPLRKLVLMAGSDDLELPAELARAVRFVGALKEHLRRGADHYGDLNVYEIWREDWSRSRERTDGAVL